jgi:HEAT repeat protein
MRDLASRDGTARQRARRDLVLLGDAAVPALTRALGARSSRLRWEAAKTLVDIADPRAARALVTCLEDDNAGTRWVAAEALLALGEDALVPVLERLIDRSESVRIREGAHHVLHEVTGDSPSPALAAVLAALDGPAPEDVTPVAAAAALAALQAAGG